MVQGIIAAAGERGYVGIDNDINGGSGFIERRLNGAVKVRLLPLVNDLVDGSAE